MKENGLYLKQIGFHPKRKTADTCGNSTAPKITVAPRLRGATEAEGVPAVSSCLVSVNGVRTIVLKNYSPIYSI